MKTPVIAIYHDLVWFGGIESSELDLIKKLYYAGYRVIFAHKNQYYTKLNTLAKFRPYAKIVDINEEKIVCDILIFSALVFPYWELEEDFISKKRIGWIHFVPGKQLNYTLLGDEGFIKTIDKFISVSNKTMKETLIEQPLIDKSKIRVIHNTMDIDSISIMAQEKVDIESNDDEIVFVTVGRISPEKGIEKCAIMCQMLEDKNIKYKWYLVGAGAGGKYDLKVEEELKGHNIEWVGYQDNPYKYIARAHYGVLFTKDESWGLFIDECWYLGIPTITTLFDALKERKNYQKYGITCNQDLSNLKVDEIIAKKDILKKNLKSWKFVNEYDKWVEEFIELLKQ